MKKINIYILLLIIFSSCEDMLDEKPKSFISTANYYQNEADAEGAITGAYSTLGTDYFAIGYYNLWELQGDFLNGRGSQADVSNVGKIFNSNTIGRAGNYWATLYRLINRTNAVIANVPGIKDISDNAKTRILAEAHFLRALAYFDLVRGWGAVPLRTTESTDLSSIDAPRAPESDVYELIIKDALEAEQGLPEFVGTKTGRASKWAAKMLLAQVYLDRENWSKSAEKANDVINSGKFSLVLVNKPDDFYKIFAAETHSEDIMSVHHSPTSPSRIARYLHIVGAFPYNYESLGVFAWLPITSGNSFIGESWDENDLRKDFNLYTKHLNANGDTVPLPASTPVLFKKFITNTEGLSVYSVPIYRYTEAFLTYAEAACMAEGSPSALALERLNQIKRRAYGYNPEVPSPVDYPSGMGKEEFRDAVLKERGYEFLIERRRWWDLKRTGKVKEAFAAIGKNFIDERYLWPIPLNEINNNALINQEDQNPGY